MGAPKRVVVSVKTYKELISSITQIIPKKGTNAGTSMTFINGKHWSKVEPKANDTHIVLEDITVDGTPFTNILGFSRDTRMPIEAKAELMAKYDVGYSQALSNLLR